MLGQSAGNAELTRHSLTEIWGRFSHLCNIRPPLFGITVPAELTQRECLGGVSEGLTPVKAFSRIPECPALR
jgi:hypothetical protein